MFTKRRSEVISGIRDQKGKILAMVLAVLIIFPVFAVMPLNRLFASATASLDETNCGITDSGVIVWYNGEETDIIIPENVSGIPVTEIADGAFFGMGLTSVSFSASGLTIIGAQAFQDNNLTSVCIPDTVVSIGAQAFQNNDLTSIDLADTVESIGSQAFFGNRIGGTLVLPTNLTALGNNAFQGNRLTSVVLPEALTEIPDGAFVQNPKLSSVNLEHIQRIGDSAFSGCNFDTVVLPAILSFYGENVFVNNGRFVLVSGSPLARTYAVPGQFGEIADEIRTLTVKYQDIKGKTLLDTQTFTTDRTNQDSSVDLVVDGALFTITIPQIPGYESKDGESKTVGISGDMEYIVVYINDSDPPVLYGLGALVVEVGETVDAAALMDQVYAEDAAGNDVTSSITIDKSSIDTSFINTWKVKYTATDARGNKTVEYRDVIVGGDPMDGELDFGWRYSDFEYSADGKTILGLSAGGQIKFDGGNTKVSLPGVCPKAPNGIDRDVPVTAIADGTDASPVFPQNFTLVLINRMASLKRIGDYAFGNSGFTLGTTTYALNLTNCYDLEYIGDYAFKRATAENLDFTNCYRLKSIGHYAFNSAPLTALDLTQNTELEKIGDFCFAAAVLNELDLTQNNKLKYLSGFNNYNSTFEEIDFSLFPDLEIIGMQAFLGVCRNWKTVDLNHNPKLKEIGNSAFYYLSYDYYTYESENYDESLTFALNGPSLETIGEQAFFFAFENFKGNCKLDLTGSPNLKTIKYGAFFYLFWYATGEITIDGSGLTKLESIGDSAFHYTGARTERDTVATVDFSGCTSLKTLGNSVFRNAFNGEGITDMTIDFSGCSTLETVPNYSFNYAGEYAASGRIDFSGCTSLKLIGDYAFYYMGYRKLNTTEQYFEIDLSGCSQLARIYNGAFYYVPATSLDLSGCTALEAIDSYVFYNHKLSEIDFSGLTSLKSISYSAFAGFRWGDYSTSPYNAHTRSIKFTGCSALEEIMYGAFSNHVLEELDFTGCTSLKTIGPNAFSGYQDFKSPMDDIDFSPLTALEKIDSAAFQNISLTSLDLRANSKLKSIYGDAFASIPNLSQVYLPDSAVDLMSNAFGSGSGRATFVNTPTVPHPTLNDLVYGAGTANETWIFINKSAYILDLRDEDNNPIPFYKKYGVLTKVPNGTTVTVTPPDIAYYTAPAAQSLTLDGTNQQVVTFKYTKKTSWIPGNPAVSVTATSPNRYLVPNQMRIDIRFDITSPAVLAPGSEIRIPVYDENINLSNVAISGVLTGAIKSWHIEGREIVLVMPDGAIGGQGITSFPILLRYDQYTTPYDWETHFTAYITDGETGEVVAASDPDPSPPVKVIGYYNKRPVYPYVSSPDNNYYNNTSEVTANRKIAVTDEMDVALGWTLSTATGAMRNIGSVYVVYDIPKYLDNDGVTERYAQFIPQNNPGWTVTKWLDGIVGGTPIQVAQEGCPSSASGLLSEYTLKLRFPNAKDNQTVRADFHTIYIPKNPTQTEIDMEADAKAGIALSSNVLYAENFWNFYIPTSADIPEGYIMRIDKKINNSSSYQSFYEDTSNQEFNWDLIFNIASGCTMTNSVIKDYDLDERMYYYAVKNGSVTSGAISQGMIAGKVEIVAYDEGDHEILREVPVTSTFIFPENIREQIKRVEIEIFGEVKKSTSYQIVSKLKNPSLTYDEALADSVDFYNWAGGECDYTRGESEDGHVVSDIGTWSRNFRKILKISESLSVTKAVSPTGQQFMGTRLTYTLGINGNKRTNAVWDGFAVVDVLPNCLALNEVRPSSAFLSLPGAKYQVIDDYNGSGKTAVLFTADKFNIATQSGGYFSGFKVAEIDATIGYLYNNQTNFTNEAFAKVDTDGITLSNSVPASSSYNFNGANPASRAAASNGYLSVGELQLRKYVRRLKTGDNAWNPSGIVTEPDEEFAYKITLHNMTDEAQPDGIVYDIFPYLGDTYISDKPRGSQFKNTLVEVVEVPDGWTVWYTTDVPFNNRDFYHNATWTKTPGLMSNVTGIKFVADDGVMIPAQGEVSFFIKMKAPSNPSLVGLKAYNTAAHIEDWVGDPERHEIECPRVCNEIVKYGSIELKKVNEGSDALAGAVFQLFDSDNNLIATKESGAGGIIRFENLPVGNYKIRETKAPSGYEKLTGDIMVTEDQMMNALNSEVKLGSIRNELIPPPPLPPPTGSAMLTKNSTSGHILQGVQFKVTGSDEGQNSNISITKATNSLGQVRFDDLPLGNYKIEEIWTGSLGYLEANWNDAFKLTSDGQIWTPASGGVVLNDAGKLTLVKIGIFSEAYRTLENNKLQDSMGQKLQGIKFELWDGSNEVTSSHTENNITNINGQVTFAGLILGKTYTLKEIMTTAQEEKYTPRGTGDGCNEYTFSIDINGKLTVDGYTYENYQNMVIGNNAIDPEYTALLRKVDGNGAPLADVEFEIATKSNFSDAQSVFTDGNGELLITKAILQAMFGLSAPPRYYIREVNAPTGYYKSFGSDSVWEINWNNPDGYDEMTFTNHEISLNLHKYTVVASTVYDVIQYLKMTELFSVYSPSTKLANVSVTHHIDMIVAAKAAGLDLRVNAAGTQLELRMPLEGAEFQVTQTTGENAGQTFIGTTLEDGFLSFESGIVIDENETYSVVETSAPENYVLDSTPITFKVSDLKLTGKSVDGKVKFNNGNISLDFDNKPMTGRITITKIDRRTGIILPRVEFTLYTAGDSIVEKNSTDANGVAVFQNLPLGSYKLIETEELSGYEKNATEYLINLTSQNDQENQYFTIRNETIEKYSRLEITKKNNEGTLLQGIEFYLQVWNADQQRWLDYTDTHEPPYRFTDRMGKLSFNWIPAGKYRIMEITDDPQYGMPIFEPTSDGFDEQSPNVFTVSGDKEKTFTITVTNPLPVEPAISKDVEGKAHHRILNRNEAFTWNIMASFGNVTNRWTKATIIDEIEGILETKKEGINVVEIAGLKETPVDTKLYIISVEGNLLTVTFQKDADENFDYLSGKKYKISVPTIIKESTTNAELEAFMAVGGIPNQAELECGTEGKFLSNIPTVEISSDPGNPGNPSNPGNPGNSAAPDGGFRNGVRTGIGNYPITGENSTLLIFANITILLSFVGMIFNVRQRKRRKTK